MFRMEGLHATSLLRAFEPESDLGEATGVGCGFAGATPTDPWFFSQFSEPGDVGFLGCDLQISRRYGRSNPGAASFVRKRTKSQRPWEPGLYDLGSVVSSEPSEALIELADTAALVAKIGGLPLLIGCDHTMSLAGLLGSARDLAETPVYVYFDAHFDLGRNCDAADLLHNGGFVGEMLRKRWASCAVNIGGRSAATKMDYPQTPRFVSIPAQPAAGTILQCLGPLRGKPVYVSIDADVLDPSEAPNVPCPEPGGLTAEVLLTCCRWLGRNCRVVGADLTEVLPSAEPQGAEVRLMECLLALRPG